MSESGLRSSIARHDAPVDRPPSDAGSEPEWRSATRRLPVITRQKVLLQGLVPLVFFAIFIAVWQYASSSGWQPDYILPTPSTIAEDLWQSRDGYWDNTKTTLEEIGIGFPIGVGLGLLIGALIGLIPVLRNTAYPFVVASQSLPVLALAPLLVLWFGFGIVPRVIIVVQVVFFPVAIATITGLGAVSQQALVFGRTLGASWWKLLTKIRIPAAMPHIFSGLKISASYAAVAAVIAEFAGAQSGLGALMLRANDNFQTEAVFGSLVLITAIGVGAFMVMSVLERIVVPWHERFRDEA
jgi:NitT/TauT family transport system permease protein